MRLPPGFAHVWLRGYSSGSNPARGWKVRIGDKACFIPAGAVRGRGWVRKRLEAMLGLTPKPTRTAEEKLVARARTRAQAKRAFRNKVAKGEYVPSPWATPRTVRAAANEERSLDIAQKWQRMGEYRR